MKTSKDLILRQMIVIHMVRCTKVVIINSQVRSLITHAGRAAGMGIAFWRVSVCLSVWQSVCPRRALKGKWLELSTPNLVHVYSIAVARHALTQRSKGQRSRSHGYENRHGRTVASDACCNGLCRSGCTCRFDCLCFLVVFATTPAGF